MKVAQKNIRSMLPLPRILNLSKINVSDANAVIPQSFSSESFCISATIYDLLHLTFDANSRGKELLTNSRKWCHLFPQSSPISDKCSHSFGSLDHIALGLDLIKSPTHHHLDLPRVLFLNYYLSTNFEVTKNLPAFVKLTTLLTFNNCFTSNWIWSISTTVLLPLAPDLVLYTTDWVEIYGPLQNWSLAPQMGRIKVKVSFWSE